jgi:hypothetical protein
MERPMDVLETLVIAGLTFLSGYMLGHTRGRRRAVLKEE